MKPLPGLPGQLDLFDHATGCHYLAEPFGGITPRLDSSGQHICGGRHD